MNHQCQWHQHDLPKFENQQPLQHQDHDIESISRAESRASRVDFDKPVSLSTIFAHQVELKLAKLFGDGARRTNNTRRNSRNSRKNSIMSSTSTCRDPGPSISRQASMINRQRSYKNNESRPYESQGKYINLDTYVTSE